MNKNLKKIALIFVLLLVVNVTVFTTTKSADYYKNQEPIQQNLEQGKKYMPYCEGGFSENIIAETEDTCVADYPGNLARTIIPIASLLVLVVTTLFFTLCRKKKKNLSQK